MKCILQTALGRLGYRLVRMNDGPRPSEGLNPFFTSLQKLGFAPKHIMDVGANRGLWTREAIKFFPDAQYTLVEPQDHLKSHIQDLLDRGCKIHWINGAAGDKSGSMPMSIASRDDSSTLLPKDRYGKATGSRQTTVEVKTLNEIAASCGTPLPDMVKIDAEGFDLRVLAGASNLFGKTGIFLAEAVVCGNYENSVAEIVNFMANAGYRLMDITDLNRSPRHGVLWLCELAFLHDGSSLLDSVSSYE